MAVKIFPTVRSVYKVPTVAELAAGYVLVEAAADRQYTVLDCWVRSAGSMATANVTIGDGTTTVVTFTQAGMTNGAVLRAGTATTGVATYLLTALLVNTPIVALADATDGTATALEICLDYAVSATGETA